MDYPLKLYLERVKMWYRIYEGPDESVGPLQVDFVDAHNR